MTDTMTALIEIGNRLGVDVAEPFKHDEVWKTVTAFPRLNNRQGPDEAYYKTVGYAIWNTRILVLESRNGWDRIAKPVAGWVSEAYLK